MDPLIKEFYSQDASLKALDESAQVEKFGEWSRKRGSPASLKIHPPPIPVALIIALVLTSLGIIFEKQIPIFHFCYYAMPVIAAFWFSFIFFKRRYEIEMLDDAD